MQAKPGDRIIVRGHHVGQPDRDCVILEARGPDGSPPYLVQWEDNVHPTLMFPGPDAELHASTQDASV